MSVALLPCALAGAQSPAPAPSAAAAASAQGMVAPPQITSPEVGADHSVTFRLVAPNAKRVAVTVEGQPKPFELQQNGSGVWQWSSPPMTPQIYGYTFIVDGQRALDPRNPQVRPNLISPTTVVHVPAPTPQPWEAQDIPHGQVEHILYRSKLVTPDATDSGDRDMWVYTPPGYDPARKEKYPVLYLNHGYSDGANGWVEAGQANFILDALLHDGRIRPMVVVMPLGYGEMKIVTAGWNRVGGLLLENQQLFTKQLLGEVIPMAEARFNIARDRDHRAIAGLSMGGGHSIYTGLNHPETFAYVGAFSSAIVSPDPLNAPRGTTPAAADIDKSFKAIVPNAATQAAAEAVLAKLRHRGLADHGQPRLRYMGQGQHQGQRAGARNARDAYLDGVARRPDRLHSAALPLEVHLHRVVIPTVAQRSGGTRFPLAGTEC